MHILSKYINRLKQGDSPEAALHYTFTTTGTALIITSAVLTAGLIVLAQSTFGINATIGAMVAPIIVFALVVDFFFLPASLIFSDRKKRKRRLINGLIFPFYSGPVATVQSRQEKTRSY